MVDKFLTNTYYKFCGNRKDNQVNSKMKIYCHPYDSNKCSFCCEILIKPSHISKIWKKIHMFCNTKCYHNWLTQFN